MQHDFEVMKYCVKAWLDDVRSRTVLVEDISERLRRIESALNLRGVRLDKIGTSGSTDATISEGLASIFELREEWEEKVQECIGFFREAYNLCGPEYPNRYVVWLHDYEGLTWDEVSAKVHYSKSKVREMAVLGYGEIYEVMPGEWREIIPRAL